MSNYQGFVKGPEPAFEPPDPAAGKSLRFGLQSGRSSGKVRGRKRTRSKSEDNAMNDDGSIQFGDGDWTDEDEAKHPRAADGKFGKKGGGSKSKGHGYWGFDVSLDVVERGTTSLGQYWATGTYSAAKREAKKRAEQDARSIGGTGKQLVVRVLP